MHGLRNIPFSPPQGCRRHLDFIGHPARAVDCDWSTDHGPTHKTARARKHARTKRTQGSTVGSSPTHSPDGGNYERDHLPRGHDDGEDDGSELLDGVEDEELSRGGGDGQGDDVPQSLRVGRQELEANGEAAVLMGCRWGKGGRRKTPSERVQMTAAFVLQHSGPNLVRYQGPSFCKSIES